MVEYEDDYLRITITGRWGSAKASGGVITFTDPVDESLSVYVENEYGYETAEEREDLNPNGGYVYRKVKSAYNGEDTHTVLLQFRAVTGVDLDCDADWDGDIDEGDDPIEVEQGGLVGLGKTAPVTLKLGRGQAAPAGGTVEFTVKGGIALCADEEGSEVVAADSYPGHDVTVSLSGSEAKGVYYVKGLSASDHFGDCSVTVVYRLPCGLYAADEVAFTVVSVDVSIDGQGEEEEETEGAYALHVEDFGADPYAARATNYFKRAELRIYPSDIPEGLDTNIWIEVSGDLTHLFEKRPMDASWGETVPYSPAANVYTAADLKKQDSQENDTEPMFVVHGHERSSSLRDKKIVVKEPKTDVEDKGLFTVVKLNLVPDYDRDHSIDIDDEVTMSKDRQLFWWVNDDGDKYDCGSCYSDSGSDIPGQNQNNTDRFVNRATDVLDFFPVWVDVKEAIDLLGETEYKFVIENNGYGIVCTKLKKKRDGEDSIDCAGGFLFKDVKTADEKYYSRSAETDTEQERELKIWQPRFLGLIKSSSEYGILMTEVREGGARMKLNVLKGEKELLTVDLPVAVADVEHLYNRIHVQPEGTVESVLIDDELKKYYDADTDVIFLHGFKVSADHARGWHSEMFKRLYQSGSNARFWGVTWDGYKDPWWASPGLFYHEMAGNVAFATAKQLKKFFTGMKMRNHVVVMAHSLGNMVVSSSIYDCGWRPNQYFMLNAAVPNEAYMGRDIKPATGEAAYYMIHQDWRKPGDEYPAESYCANWYRLFNEDAAESPWRNLTWVGRFAGIEELTHVEDYYSEDDEVFEIKQGNVDMEDGSTFVSTDTNIEGQPGGPFNAELVSSFARYCWHKQELAKGLAFTIKSPLNPLFKSGWCGWAFDMGHAWYEVVDGLVVPKTGSVDTLGWPWVTRRYTAKVAREIVSLGLQAAFRDVPVFEKDPEDMFEFTNPEFATGNRDQLLGYAIPALSPAVGCPYEAPKFENSASMVDICSKLDRYNREEYNTRWLHCDIKDMAYSHNYKLYDDFVEKGNMK